MVDNIHKETLAEEFRRLMFDYERGKRQNAEEAWNLIADFAVSNFNEIFTALGGTFPQPKDKAGAAA